MAPAHVPLRGKYRFQPPVEEGILTAQQIRDSTGAQAVNDPGTGFPFATVAELITNINAQAANSIHVATASSYSLSGQNVWTAGKHPRVYVPGAPGSKVFTGGGGTDYFDADGLGGSEWHGGKFTGVGNIASPTWLRAFVGRNNMVIEDVITDGCYGAFGYDGSQVNPGMRVHIRRSEFLNSIRYGASLSGMENIGDVIVEDVEIAGNNTGHFDPGDDAGGTKWLNLLSGTFRRIWAHDNWGSGMWWDWVNRNILAEDIVSENNRLWGLFYEASYGGSTFRRWHLFNNALGAGPPGDFFGTVQALFSCDNGTLGPNADIEFTDSVVDGTARAIAVINHQGHEPFGFYTKRVKVLRNDVWLRATASDGGEGGFVGGQDTATTRQLFAEATNDFDFNTYHRAGAASFDYFKWGGAGVGEPITFAEWQAFGFDTNGSMVAI